MTLPDNAIILETATIRMEGGGAFAGIKFRVPGQGGYDRAPDDDMWRMFQGPDALAKANAWVERKLGA